MRKKKRVRSVELGNIVCMPVLLSSVQNRPSDMRRINPVSIFGSIEFEASSDQISISVIFLGQPYITALRRIPSTLQDLSPSLRALTLMKLRQIYWSVVDDDRFG